MPRITRYLHTLLAAGLLTACQTTEYLSIDYLVPAKVSFPDALRKVAIVNNVPLPSDKELKPRPEQQPDLNNAEKVYNTRYLTGDPKIAAEALAESIANENYFDEVVICDSALRAADQRPREALLTQEEVNALTQTLDVDFLVSLEDIRMTAVRKAEYSPIYGVFLANADLKVYPTVRVYLPTRKTPMLTVQACDSIYWEEGGTSLKSAYNRLPDEQETIRQGSGFAGSLPVTHLLPQWKKADRYLFGGGSVNMRDALIFAKEGEWQEAVKLWKETYDEKKGKRKMQAAYNLALGYEMQDDINTAYEWIVKAQAVAAEVDNVEEQGKDGTLDINALPNYLMVSLYMSELEERKAAIGHLRNQMQRFNGEEP